MNVLMVLAHPERASFNGGLVDVAEERLRAGGHVVELDDLYREGFDPVERAGHYAELLNENYFAPAMIKGWFDRVLVYGGLYSGSRRYDRGHSGERKRCCRRNHNFK